MKRDVIKVGTNSITRNGKIDIDAIFKVSRTVKTLCAMDRYPVLVSSGAVAAGMELKKLEKRPSDVKKLQYLSGIGARGLQNYYAAEFEKYGMEIVYIPVTWRNFEVKEESENIASMIAMAIDAGDVPILNHNDCAASDELLKIKGHPSGFYDNDFVAVKTAKLVSAANLVIITNSGDMGTGGRESKSKAIEEAIKAGIKVKVGGIKLLDDLETLLL